MIFAQTHPSFQERIDALAAKYGKPAEMVFAWWKEYARDCRYFDQSPVLMEFEQWYEPRLKGIDQCV